MYMKSYCVKQKKVTECVLGSEHYAKAKDERTMMKCTCTECGITKTKFVKQTGGRLFEAHDLGRYLAEQVARVSKNLNYVARPNGRAY